MHGIWRAALTILPGLLLILGAYSCGDDDDDDNDSDDDDTASPADDDDTESVNDDSDDDLFDDDADDDADDDVDDDNGDNLIFSEYIEGSGQNRALEFYNAGDHAVDMSMCAVQFYLDGATSPTAAQFMASEPTPLQPGEVFVTCNPGSDAALLEKCDLEKPLINFDGNDAFELLCYTTVLDVFGKIGENPGDSWGIEPCATQNQTLVRKNTVAIGDRDGGDAFDPSQQWDCYEQDTFTFLGEY